MDGDNEPSPVTEAEWQIERARTHRLAVISSGLGFVMIPVLGLAGLLLAHLTASGSDLYLAAAGWMAPGGQAWKQVRVPGAHQGSLDRHASLESAATLAGLSRLPRGGVRPPPGMAMFNPVPCPPAPPGICRVLEGAQVFI